MSSPRLSIMLPSHDEKKMPVPRIKPWARAGQCGKAGNGCCASLCENQQQQRLQIWCAHVDAHQQLAHAMTSAPVPLLAMEVTKPRPKTCRPNSAA